MTKLHRHPVLAPAVAVMLGFAGPAMAPALAMAQAAPAPAAAPDASAAPAPAAAAPAAPAPAAPAPDAAAPAAGAPAAGAPAADAPAPGGTMAPAPGGTMAPAAPGGTMAPAAPGGTMAPAAPAAANTMAPGEPPMPPAPKMAAVANPYGLDALWKGGDFITRGVLIILVIMSLGTWYIMITKFFEQGRLLSAAKLAGKNFWNKPTVQEGATSLKTSSPFRYIADSGISATEHHEGTLTDSIDLPTWVTMAITRAVETIQSRLQGGLAFLASVGSVAPFVGLFGTVWGIYHALTAIGIAGQASIDKVAGPVGEALIMTAIGLATAVPAVLGYNFLVRRNKSSMERVRYFSADLHSVLVGGTRIGVQTANAGGAPMTVTSGVTRVA